MATKKRAPRGAGSIYEDKKRPGRWIGEIDIHGKRRRVSGTSESDVRGKLNKLLKTSGTTRSTEDPTLIVSQLVELYLARELPNLTRNGRPLAPSTVGTYEWAANIVVRELGKVRVSNLTVDTVEAMFDRLAKDGMSKASLTKLRSKLGQFIAFGERRGYVNKNVTSHATLPSTAATKKNRKALPPEEARALLEVLKASRNGAMFGLSLLLGLRPGEAAGLYWEDVDLKGAPAIVNVTRGLRLDRGAATIADDLKTASSKRTLAISPDLAEWLAAHKRQQARERLAATRWTDDRLVFATRAGGPVDPVANRKYLADLCEKAEVPVVLPNELRHSCASLLADEGVPNELIADLLGHTTTRMVEQTYRHRLRPVVNVATLATWANDNKEASQ